MTVSSMIGSWFRLTQTAAGEACSSIGALADSLFVGYTIEENLLLHNRGKPHGKNKSKRRRVQATEKVIQDAPRKRVRDWMHPLPDRRNSVSPTHRPTDEGR